MGRREQIEYTADFETTTDAYDCRVWAWGVAQVGQPETFTYGISRFDSTFVMCYLLESGWVHVENRPRKGQFSALIDGLGKVYRVQIGPSVVLADSLKKITMSVADVARTYKLPYGKGEIDYDAPRPVGHELTDEEVEYLRRDVCIMALAMEKRLGVGKKLTTSADTLEAYKDLIGAFARCVSRRVGLRQPRP